MIAKVAVGMIAGTCARALARQKLAALIILSAVSHGPDGQKKTCGVATPAANPMDAPPVPPENALRIASAHSLA